MGAVRSVGLGEYVALRRGGDGPVQARRRLGLDEVQAIRFERIVQARIARGGGEDAMPRFAHHDRHVAAVMAEGGFPTLPTACDPLSSPAQGDRAGD